MTAKEFLSRAWQIEKRIDARIDERERLDKEIAQVNINDLLEGGRKG